MSTKSTLSQKLRIAKIWKLIFHTIQHITHLLRQEKCVNFVLFLSICWVFWVAIKSIISQKLTIIRKRRIVFIRLRTLHNLAMSYLRSCRLSPPPFPFPTSKKSPFHFLVQNNAKYSETNEKSFLRFLVFEIWSLNLCRYILQKTSSQKMRNDLKRNFKFLSYFCDLSFLKYCRFSIQHL